MLCSRILGNRREGAVHGMAAVAAALSLAILPLQGQQSRTVMLRINPRAGDTLYTRFEQTVEMSGRSLTADSDTAMTMKSSMLLLSHILVNASDARGATVTAVTDSVSLATWRMGRPMPSESARRSMQGKTIQLRIAPDGSATVLQAPDELASDVRAAVSAMPSTLPDHPIAVGDSWKEATDIPMSASTGGSKVGGGRQERAATLSATYRLDSLSADGNMAYISVRGTVKRDSTAAPLPRGLRVSSTGSITGAMRVDRRRGWWADSHAIITLESTLTPTRTSAERQGGGAETSRHLTSPMHVRTRIEQRMHTGGGW